ncbi:unnamed protein product [Durusdinium trenchii]|uniref:Uncharacterized protein n=2 Tax=Durusdinium trenchii TaxID=1381693 RepID=A0ABP0RA94_9DINO
MRGVALFKKLDEEVLRDADLSGPLMICLTLGLALLLAGKLQFGYVYGLAAGGSFSICCLINVMSQKEGRRCAEQNTVVPLASCTFALSLNLCQKFCQQAPGIDLYSTMSILGYGLIPIVFLALFGIIVSLKHGAECCTKWGMQRSAFWRVGQQTTSDSYFDSCRTMNNEGRGS